MRQTINSYVCLEGQSYETVLDPVGLVVSRIEGVAILPTLAALPHSPLLELGLRGYSRNTDMRDYIDLTRKCKYIHKRT